MKRLVFLILFLGLSLIFGSLNTTRADVLFEQPPNSAGGYYHSSRWDPDGSDWDQYVWDAFRTTTNASITEIRWRGAFDPTYFGSGGPVRYFRIAIHASIAAGTEPDVVNPPLYYRVVTGDANQTPAGQAGGVNMYDYTFTLPTPFVATANTK